MHTWARHYCSNVIDWCLFADPPQNFAISPPNLHGNVYYPSAQFSCSASANPSLVPMSYTWSVTTANNTLTINGPNLQLTTNMVGSVTAQCQAFNTIRGIRRVSTSSSYTFTVLGKWLELLKLHTFVSTVLGRIALQYVVWMYRE